MEDQRGNRWEAEPGNPGNHREVEPGVLREEGRRGFVPGDVRRAEMGVDSVLLGPASVGTERLVLYEKLQDLCMYRH